MKIIVKSEGYRFFVPIPTGFLCSRPMVRLWLGMMRRSQRYVDLPEQARAALWNLPEEKILILCDELRRIKKRNKQWTLVEVESSDGDRVKIIL